MKKVLLIAMTTSLVMSACMRLPVGTRGQQHLAGLQGPAQVIRDSRDIPHLVASSDHDAFFLQGYVHASDRLFQMDLSRRQASGTEAELLGPGLLNADVQTRIIGIRRAGERSLADATPEGRAALEAYSAGVNAWVASHPLPKEYADVEVTTFAPWTPLDSATLVTALAFNLSFDIDIFRGLDVQGFVAAGQTHGFDGEALYRDVNPIQPFSDAATVPDATTTPAQAEASHAPVARSSSPATDGAANDETVADAARKYYNQVKDVPFFKKLHDRRSDTGSNEWAVAGSLTENGRPLLANDPHLDLAAPSTFYPMGLRTPTIDVVGDGFAGVPAVIVGANRDVAWGATTAYVDVTDSYQEQVVDDPSSPSGLSTVFRGQRENVIAIPEVFKTNSPHDGSANNITVVPPGTDVGSQLGPLPDRSLIVPRRNDGPLLIRLGSVGLSIQYTGFSANHVLDTFLIWNKAKNLDDFRRGLPYFGIGAQNWSYQDRAGNIAYFMSGESPLREDLQAGAFNGAPPWFIRNGTGGNEWLPVTHPQPGQAIPYEILPPAEMPHVVNPPAGFFVNANNDAAGVTLDGDPLDHLRPNGGIYYLNRDYDGYRAGRITEAIKEHLAADGKISFADMQAIQADVKLIDAEFFVPYITQSLGHAQASDTPELRALANDPGVVEAVGRFARWDFSAPTGIAEGYDASDVDGHRTQPSADEVAASVAATIYSVWRGRFITNTIDATLSPLGVTLPGSSPSMAALRHLFENFATDHGKGEAGLDFLASAGVASPEDRRDVVILRSLRTALDLLQGDAFAQAYAHSSNQNDYRWGLIHRIVFGHPLGGSRNVPPAGSFAPTLPNGLVGFATDGGWNTVDQAFHSGFAATPDEFMFFGGPVRRWVSESDPDGIRAESSLPGGVSGDVTSPYYANLLPGWLTNDTFEQTLQRGELVREALSVSHYRP